MATHWWRKDLIIPSQCTEVLNFYQKSGQVSCEVKSLPRRCSSFAKVAKSMGNIEQLETFNNVMDVFQLFFCNLMRVSMPSSSICREAERFGSPWRASSRRVLPCHSVTDEQRGSSAGDYRRCPRSDTQALGAAIRKQKQNGGSDFHQCFDTRTRRPVRRSNSLCSRICALMVSHKGSCHLNFLHCS